MKIKKESNGIKIMFDDNEVIKRRYCKNEEMTDEVIGDILLRNKNVGIFIDYFDGVVEFEYTSPYNSTNCILEIKDKQIFRFDIK